MLGVVGHGGTGRRITVLGQLGKSVRPYLKNKLKQKGLDMSLSGRKP
jgi:hypothetical protein